MAGTRTTSGPGAYLADHPGAYGQVAAIRAALDRALRADDTASIDSLVSAARAAIDRSGGRQPRPERLRALVEKLIQR